MTAFERTFHIGPDGKVHFDVPPELANKDVRITVQPTTNGAHSNDPAREHRRQLLDRVLGTIDDPTFVRPPSGAWRDPEQWD